MKNTFMKLIEESILFQIRRKNNKNFFLQKIVAKLIFLIFFSKNVFHPIVIYHIVPILFPIIVFLLILFV